MHYLTLFILLLVASLGCIYPTNAQEEDSLQWISKFYGIGWPYGNCASIPSNSTYYVSCDSVGRTTEITLNILRISDYGPPDPLLTYFYLPSLRTFNVIGELGSGGIRYPSNIMDMFTNVTNIEVFSYTGSNEITSIPDIFFQNNYKLSMLTINACNRLTSINLSGNSGNFSLIRIIYTPISSIDFGSVYYTYLNSLSISYAGDFAINIPDAQFPYLNILSISSIDNVAQGNLTSNSTKLNSVSVEGSYNQVNLDLNCSNVIRLTLYVDSGNGIVNLSRPLYQSVPNLQSLTSKSLKPYNYPSLSNLNKLNEVFDSFSINESLPYIPPSVSWLSFNYEGLTKFPTPFMNASLYYDSFNFNSNFNLSGTVPDAFCNAKYFDLAGTNITSLSSLPLCMQCYYKSLKNNFRLPVSFPTTILPPLCNVSVSPKNYISMDGLTITITGSSLGWLFNSSDYSPGLVTRKANVEYLYTFPSQYRYTSNYTTVYFSLENNVYANISWIYPIIQINNIIYDQVPTGLVRIRLNGRFETSLTYDIQVSTVSNTLKSFPVNFINSSVAEIVVNQTDLSLSSTNVYMQNGYNSYSKSFTYVQQFPLVDSIYPAVGLDITPGSIVQIDGTFSQDYYNMTKIILNNNSTLECIIQTTSPSSVTCQLPSALAVGVTSLQVDVVGFTTPLQYFMVKADPVDPPKCLNNCSGNGECNSNGECKCYPEYSGEACQYPNNNGTIFHPQNDTTASFESNGYQFNFTLVSIQELDIRDEIVTELLTNNWTSITTNTSVKTTIQYTLNTTKQPSLIVRASIIFTKQPSSYIYGGVNNTLPANSLKISVFIQNWSYQTQLNRLRVVFKTNIAGTMIDSCGNLISGTTLLYNQVKGLKYLKVQKNGIVFFGTFSDIVVANNRPVYTVNQVLNQTSSSSGDETQSTIFIGVMLPNCQQCLIDPDFSALVDTHYKAPSDDCNVPKTNNTWKIVVGVVVGGLASIAITTAGIITYKKNIKRKRDNIKLQNKLKQIN